MGSPTQEKKSQRRKKVVTVGRANSQIRGKTFVNQIIYYFPRYMHFACAIKFFFFFFDKFVVPVLKNSFFFFFLKVNNLHLL